MRIAIAIFTLLLCGYQPQPEVWDGPTLTRDRAHLTVGELTHDEKRPLVVCQCLIFGLTWQEASDGERNRGSFPLTLTNRQKLCCHLRIPARYYQ